jgi:hypothetical protein
MHGKVLEGSLHQRPKAKRRRYLAGFLNASILFDGSSVSFFGGAPVGVGE